ncbi:MAG TPA: glycosyltransferase family 4 protein [Candidatus Omnitrophota bacterium]|nr:glycosyltransferase family 4 protein [Candidatus Omnitrophota bacterium]HPN66837.1 glycosyltransferase family 4 protein [Candidatus Omnitrophota bacterium]HRZ67239.1 glycosyltransferase family 4 protein [Candidatus Omnitrophota bacterium]
MRVLFLEPYPTEGPSSRYRVEQYIPYLRQNGIECEVRPFVSSAFYRILYKKGMYLRKLAYFAAGSFRRIADLFAAFSSDVVFIHLEAFPFGPPAIEWLLAAAGKKIIYDLDDAIYLGSASSTNSFLKGLKCPWKIPKIIAMSRRVITCNEYLAEYVSKYNREVTVIHTSVDTEKFKPLSYPAGKPAGRPAGRITIGWIGSHSTAKYLESIKGVFEELVKRGLQFRLKIIGASGRIMEVPGAEVIYKDWSLKDEIAEFQSIDIGVYPLTDDEWTAGKTGFKTIQYMSVGIPCVASNASPNRVIIEEGRNGFLAKDTAEWVEKLSKLMGDASLRQRIGEAGRRTVLERYSLEVNAPKIMGMIRKTAGEK